MLKWLITIGIIYFIYRFYIAPPPRVDKGRDERVGKGDDVHIGRKPKGPPPGEYVDYEEVDDK